ncbi:MAG: imidazole glycerol phosphate synthase subunit HisF [Candidatus Aureabacteria bacterium]|nr:imidazole glycerol phosphate synthase subunit HisF [Candidatus Auribacterota bacterium]
MLAKRIIPCLDVKDGRVVKGTKFLNLRDAGDPVEAAIEYDRQKADELVFLDITASSDNREIIYDVVARTAENIFIPLTVGGGIRSIDDVRKILLSGADKVAINTSAVQNPKIISESSCKFGSQCIVTAIDAKRNDPKDPTKGWEVFIHGGRTPTGIDACSWAKKAVMLGSGEILLTSMDADGTKEGYDIELNKIISESVKVPVIASGGAGTLQHMLQVLEKGKADAVLAASIFHYKEFTVSNIKDYLKKNGIEVRE